MIWACSECTSTITAKDVGAWQACGFDGQAFLEVGSLSIDWSISWAAGNAYTVKTKDLVLGLKVACSFSLAFLGADILEIVSWAFCDTYTSSAEDLTFGVAGVDWRWWMAEFGGVLDVIVWAFLYTCSIIIFPITGFIGIGITSTSMGVFDAILAAWRSCVIIWACSMAHTIWCNELLLGATRGYTIGASYIDLFIISTGSTCTGGSKLLSSSACVSNTFLWSNSTCCFSRLSRACTRGIACTI